MSKPRTYDVINGSPSSRLQARGSSTVADHHRTLQPTCQQLLGSNWLSSYCTLSYEQTCVASRHGMLKSDTLSSTVFRLSEEFNISNQDHLGQCVDGIAGLFIRYANEKHQGPTTCSRNKISLGGDFSHSE